MISAERLRDLYAYYDALAMRAGGMSLTERGTALRTAAALAELEAARARIASLEMNLNERSAQLVSALGELVVLRAQGLSQEDREAIDLGFIMIEQAADDSDNEGRGDGTRSKAWRAKAAILRRLGGQTT